MAGLLGKLGVVAVFANFVSQHLAGIDWFWASFIISATFVYSQYFFASGTARITALFSAFAVHSRGYGRTNSVYHLALWFDEQSWLYINSL